MIFKSGVKDGFVEQDSTLFRTPLPYALLRNLEISVYPRRPYMLSIQSSFHAVYPRWRLNEFAYTTALVAYVRQSDHPLAWIPHLKKTRDGRTDRGSSFSPPFPDQKMRQTSKNKAVYMTLVAWNVSEAGIQIDYHGPRQGDAEGRDTQRWNDCFIFVLIPSDLYLFFLFKMGSQLLAFLKTSFHLKINFLKLLTSTALNTEVTTVRDHKPRREKVSQSVSFWVHLLNKDLRDFRIASVIYSWIPLYRTCQYWKSTYNGSYT